MLLELFLDFVSSSCVKCDSSNNHKSFGRICGLFVGVLFVDHTGKENSCFEFLVFGWKIIDHGSFGFNFISGI